MFNYFRALNSMSSNPDFYPGFTNDMGIFNLAYYDINFILPVLMMINNFILIKKIDHPWLINYRNNNLKILYLSFVLGIFTIVWPKSYCLSYLSYSLTHIVVKIIADKIHSRRVRYLSYNSHVERVYRKKVENIKK